MSSAKEFFKSLITDGNKINESNIILGIATIMLVFIDGVALCKNLDAFVIMLVGEHLLFIFLMCKSEHSKLDANRVIEVAGEVLKK